MGTMWAEVICDFGMVQINDVRLEEELQNNPALFFRKMALYLKNAIPRFNKPPEEQIRLTGTPPQYDSYSFTTTEEGEQTISTDLMGYELCSVQLIQTDAFGNPEATPVAGFQYDAETGVVTVPSGLAVGSVLSIDFYTDGTFDNDLLPEEKEILGICLQMVWENRFSGSWLDRVPKPKGKSFDIPSEAPQTNANTNRMKFLQKQLNSKMRAYSQMIAYQNVVPVNKQLQF